MGTAYNPEESSWLGDFVHEQTRALDVVASWGSLCDTYRALEFSDPLNDATRLEEFKWIIKQMNSFLTKQRTKLNSCRDLDSMVEYLRNSFSPEGKVNLDQRKALAYQKLRQVWILQMITMLQERKEQEVQEDVWTNGDDE